MVYDVAIIGGGVIGCATLHELSGQGIRCILLEKDDNLVSGASCGNSGLYHLGFDSTPNTLEADCLQEARQLNEEFYQENEIPYDRCGALMVAWKREELPMLQEIVDRANALSIEVKMLTKYELFQKEPKLSTDALAAVWIPGEGVVDPWLLPIILAHRAIRQGAEIRTACKVEGGTFDTNKRTWTLKTSSGAITFKVCINAAGLYGDVVEEICQRSKFDIRPRMGQFIMLKKEASNDVSSIILPPISPSGSKITKGILIFSTVWGNVVIGPTAEKVPYRTGAVTDAETVNKLISEAKRIIPDLKPEGNIVATYAGLRPATQFEDYQIYTNQKNWITVGGIRSTGLTACLAIAKRVSSLLTEFGVIHCPIETIQKHKLSVRYAGKNSVVLDGAEYKITHPISKIGTKAANKSKL